MTQLSLIVVDFSALCCKNSDLLNGRQRTHTEIFSRSRAATEGNENAEDVDDAEETVLDVDEVGDGGSEERGVEGGIEARKFRGFRSELVCDGVRGAFCEAAEIEARRLREGRAAVREVAVETFNDFLAGGAAIWEDDGDCWLYSSANESISFWEGEVVLRLCREDLLLCVANRDLERMFSCSN